MTVTRKPDHRGEHEISRKTIARGMPGVSGVTVVTNARAFYPTRAAAGASGARHSLLPLILEGQCSCTTRPHRAARTRTHTCCLQIESEMRVSLTFPGRGSAHIERGEMG
jgi:hypothetical protein